MTDLHGAACRCPKIDIYNHVMPPAYLELMKQRYADGGMVKRIVSIRNVWDMESRVALLDKFPDVQQVLTLATPAPEMMAGPNESPDLARVANDGMAEICATYPSKFPAFVAAMPMNNVPAAIKEMDRAIDKLGARGIEIKTNVNGRPLDDPVGHLLDVLLDGLDPAGVERRRHDAAEPGVAGVVRRDHAGEVLHHLGREVEDADGTLA